MTRTLPELADTLTSLEQEAWRLDEVPEALSEQIAIVRALMEELMTNRAGPDGYILGEVEASDIGEETIGEIAHDLENIGAELKRLAA